MAIDRLSDESLVRMSCLKAAMLGFVAGFVQEGGRDGRE